MIFKKKKMVDVRDLQKAGRLAPINHQTTTQANKEGFVDFSKKDDKITAPLESPISSEANSNETVEAPANVFGFMTPSPEPESFSTESNGYSKKEVDGKIEQLDNKIYKMEQRIELLERKAGVSQSNQPTGAGLW